jgi:hypothetical protein
VYRSDGSPLTDCDIEMNNIIIQVKSGTGSGMTRQLLNSSTASDKIVIGYDPDLNSSSALVKDAKSLGYDVFTNLNDLINFIATH